MTFVARRRAYATGEQINRKRRSRFLSLDEGCIFPSVRAVRSGQELRSETVDGLVATAAGTGVGILDYEPAQEVQGQVSALPSARR